MGFGEVLKPLSDFAGVIGPGVSLAKIAIKAFPALERSASFCKNQLKLAIAGNASQNHDIMRAIQLAFVFESKIALEILYKNNSKNNKIQKNIANDHFLRIQENFKQIVRYLSDRNRPVDAGLFSDVYKPFLRLVSELSEPKDGVNYDDFAYFDQFFEEFWTGCLGVVPEGIHFQFSVVSIRKYFPTGKLAYSTVLRFIEFLKDQNNTEIWRAYQIYALSNIEALVRGRSAGEGETLPYYSDPFTDRAVERRFDTLAKNFYGRDSDLKDLMDCFDENTDRGVIVLVHGSAGVGKSALLAKWRSLLNEIRNNRNFEDRENIFEFVSYCFSANEPDTLKKDMWAQSLARSLRHSEFWPKEKIPGRDAANDLRSLVGTTFAGEKKRRLVLLIDGLDEAGSDISLLNSEGIAEGVLIVVSARSNQAGVLPAALERWKQEAEKRGDCWIEKAVSPLERDDIFDWLNGGAGPLPELQYEELVTVADQLMDVSGGYGIIISQIIESCRRDSVVSIELVKKVIADIVERTQLRAEFSGDSPDPVRSYLSTEIDRFRRDNSLYGSDC